MADDAELSTFCLFVQGQTKLIIKHSYLVVFGSIDLNQLLFKLLLRLSHESGEILVGLIGFLIFLLGDL